jgi:SAM-dependent methyltransferase
VSAELIWHEVECGAYAADLPLWERLAAESDGPVLDLGCGTGRVALHLARQGREVLGVDMEPAYVAELNRRSADERLDAVAVSGDVLNLDLDRRFGLAIAPMQLLHLIAPRNSRANCVASVARYLEPGGRFAAALLGELPPADPNRRSALPDVREVDGWVYSSLPLGVDSHGGTVTVDRLRQCVSPAGELEEEESRLVLHPCLPGELEENGRALGLRVLPRREIAATADHVGSTVVVLEAPK